MRKTRPDAKLLNLPEDQYQTLVDWLLAGLPYREVKRRLAEEMSISTSDAALSKFWSTCCGPALLARRQRAVSMADEIAEAVAARPGEFDAATVDALKQKAFELAINPQADPRDVKGLFMLVLKARAQDIDREELRLAQDRFRRETAELFIRWAADQRAREIADAKGVGTEEKIEQLGKLMFGEEW